MARVVYNNIHGGFSLSKDVCTLLNLDFQGREISRTSPALLYLMDELGSEYCSGKRAKLEIARIPAEWDGCWKIDEYDGAECILFDGAKWLEKKMNLVKLSFPVTNELIETILNKYKELSLCT